MLLLELNCHNIVPMHSNAVHRDSIEFAFPSDMYTAMAILNLILIPSLPFPVDSVCSVSIVDFAEHFHRECFFGFRLMHRVACGGLSVYHLTMAIGQSPRPILFMSAECTCGLLIYILVNLITVGICDPTNLGGKSEFRIDSDSISNALCKEQKFQC